MVPYVYSFLSKSQVHWGCFVEGTSHLLQGEEWANRIRLSKRMNLNLRGAGAGANLFTGNSWTWPVSVQEEPQGKKGIDPWDMTGPENGQLRTHKANAWIQGLTRWVSGVVTLLFRSLWACK